MEIKYTDRELNIINKINDPNDDDLNAFIIGDRNPHYISLKANDLGKTNFLLHTLMKDDEKKNPSGFQVLTVEYDNMIPYYKIKPLLDDILKYMEIMKNVYSYFVKDELNRITSLEDMIKSFMKEYEKDISDR